MSRRIIVAIDGPAGAGKSTIARRIAAKLGFLYIDTGAMYRAVAVWAMRLGVPLDDVQRVEQLARNAVIELAETTVCLNGEDVTTAIRTPEAAAASSRISAIAGVRRALVEKQREMAERSSVVMEGRDIGTVVFPEAEVKIFLDAGDTVRASRRIAELEQKGQAVDAAEIARQVRERDARDRARVASPLVQAPDAYYLDSTDKSIAEVEEAILKLVRDRTSNGKELER